MATTQLADVIQPKEFTAYLRYKTAQKSNLFRSGVLDPNFNEWAEAPGREVEMPKWNDLTGDDEVLDDGGVAITAAKLTATSEVATIAERARAFSVNDLARIRTNTYGDPNDPVAVVLEGWSDYWARRHQARMISTLKGIFAIASMNANKLDLALPGAGTPTSANWLTGATAVDARQKLGDSQSTLSAIMMHSAVRAHLVKQDLIDYALDQEANTQIEFFQGMQLVVDDALAAATVGSNPAYRTYLFGRGAIAYGEDTREKPSEAGAANSDWYIEWERKASVGDTVMYTRNRTIMHPRGLKWLGAAYSAKSATNADLENAANWLAVDENKNIRLVEVRHNIA